MALLAPAPIPPCRQSSIVTTTSLSFSGGLPWRTVRLVLPFALLALVLLVLPVPLPLNPITRTIYLDASQYQFTPGRVEVQQGDRVIINLTASDVVHGFYLDGYDLQTRVEPGVTQRIEFVADRVGKFRYRCSVSCGPMHPFMIGELVVGPNIPFWRAAAVMVTSLTGMLVYLWQNRDREQVQE